MSDDKKSESSSHDLLGIVESLVDNLQEINNSNNETLRSINGSLIKVSETLPELKDVSAEVRSISQNFKIVVAILSIIFTLGLTIIGLNISKMESNIIHDVTIKMDSTFERYIGKIEEKIKVLEDMKK